MQNETGPQLRVVARPHLLNAERFVGCLPVGMTLSEIVQECYRRGEVPIGLRRGAIVQINGEIVPPAMWARIRPKPSAHVCVSVSLGGGGGGGGKNPMAIVLTIAIIVAAVYTGGLLGAPLAGALGISEAAGTAMVTLAAPSAGALLVNSAEFPS